MRSILLFIHYLFSDEELDGPHDYYHHAPIVYLRPPAKLIKRLPKRGSSDEELLSYLRGMDGASELMSMLQTDQK